MLQGRTESSDFRETLKFSLSIVIPARNEENRLPRTLQHINSFASTKGWDTEVIVVNDGLTDGTSDVVRQFAKGNPSISLIENLVNAGK